MRPVKDNGDWERASAIRRDGDYPVEPHGQIAETAVLRKTFLDDCGFRQVVFDCDRQRIGCHVCSRIRGWLDRFWHG